MADGLHSQTVLKETAIQEVEEVINSKFHGFTESMLKLDAKLDVKFTEMIEALRLLAGGGADSYSSSASSSNDRNSPTPSPMLQSHHNDDPITELKNLKETDGIMSYHCKFETIRPRVQLYESYLVSAYLAGLRNDTQMNVRMFRPHTIRQCFSLAKLYEEAHPRIGSTATGDLAIHESLDVAQDEVAAETISSADADFPILDDDITSNIPRLDVATFIGRDVKVEFDSHLMTTSISDIDLANDSLDKEVTLKDDVVTEDTFAEAEKSDFKSGFLILRNTLDSFCIQGVRRNAAETLSSFLSFATPPDDFMNAIKRLRCHLMMPIDMQGDKDYSTGHTSLVIPSIQGHKLDSWCYLENSIEDWLRMVGVDKERVQKVVYKMSNGSKYFAHEERKEALMKQHIQNMRVLCSSLTPSDLSRFQRIAEEKIVMLEATRDLTRIWLQLDRKVFYAAVETLSNPSLKGKPMAVGGMSMICCTAHYEARQFEVRAARHGFIARKLCPELIFVRTNFKKYTHYSDFTRKVFHDYDPKFIAASLNDAYLDITETCKARSMSGAEITDELRARIYEETGLTCSAGVAPKRLLAKVCSDINTPNGQFILPNDRIVVMTFISSLPIRKLGGIGKVTENIFKDVFGFNTCEQQLLQKDGYLCALFSQSSADFFLSVGLGLGSVHTPKARMRKSISNERTFPATENKDTHWTKLADLIGRGFASLIHTVRSSLQYWFSMTRPPEKLTLRTPACFQPNGRNDTI